MFTPQLDQTAFKFLNKCLHVVKYEIYKLTSGIGIILAIEISGGEGWQRFRKSVRLVQVRSDKNGLEVFRCKYPVLSTQYSATYKSDHGQPGIRR